MQGSHHVRSQVLLVAILVAAAFSVAFASPGITAQTPTRSLGFWLQEGDVLGRYTPSAFFNAMFLTPPYPSSIEVMVFGITQDEMVNLGCSTSANGVGESVSYWGQVAKMADAYPNIKLTFAIAFDPSNGGSGTYGLGCFKALAQSLAQYPSVYGIGIEGEYTRPQNDLTASMVQAAMNDVTSVGKKFINYYVPFKLIPSGGYDIVHSNFPAQGDQVNSLQPSDPSTIGLSAGYYDTFQFPSTFTCPIGPNAVASGALTNEPQGWDQCVVSTILSVTMSLAATQRQFLELCPGLSSSGYFTGVSGQSTNQLWDNPTLRSWIWTSPNYQGNFVLSTSSAGTAGTKTSTTSTSHTRTTTTSAHSSTAPRKAASVSRRGEPTSLLSRPSRGPAVSSDFR